MKLLWSGFLVDDILLSVIGPGIESARSPSLLGVGSFGTTGSQIAACVINDILRDTLPFATLLALSNTMADQDKHSY